MKTWIWIVVGFGCLAGLIMLLAGLLIMASEDDGTKDRDASDDWPRCPSCGALLSWLADLDAWRHPRPACAAGPAWRTGLRSEVRGPELNDADGGRRGD